MRIVHRNALVPHSAVEMFALVDHVEAYPEFLPWCNSVEVHVRESNIVEATLEMHRGSVSKHFRTRNTSIPGEKMDIALVDGPFSALAGGWTFRQLGDAGCKVALQMEFEFSSKAVDLILGAFFEVTCNSLVDAFVKRAQHVYGDASGSANLG